MTRLTAQDVQPQVWPLFDCSVTKDLGRHGFLAFDPQALVPLIAQPNDEDTPRHATL